VLAIVQDFVFLLLASYLKRCGVASRGFRRFPYMTKDNLVAEQFTIRKYVDVSEEVRLAGCGGGGVWIGMKECKCKCACESAASAVSIFCQQARYSYLLNA